MLDPERPASVRAPQTVITLPPEIDVANAGSIGEELASALVPGLGALIADLSRTTFCDSSGVHMLATASKRAAANHTDLRLAVASAGVLRVFALTGLDRLVPIFPSLTAALSPEPVREG